MIPGVYGIGDTVPLGALKDGDLLAVYDPLAVLFEAADKEQITLAEIAYWDTQAAAERMAYFASEPFVSEPDDAAPNRYYEGRLAQPLRAQQSVVGSDKPAGRSGYVTGAIEIINTDAGLSSWLQGAPVNGRAVTIKTLDRGAPLDDAQTIFVGVADSQDYTLDTVTVAFRSKQMLIDLPVQTELFDGTGGAEGGSDLKGKPKPIALGYAYNVSPVYLGLISGFRSYLVSGGWALPIQDVPALFHKGVSFTKVGSAPAAGQYAIDTTTGIIQIGNSDALPITCDVEGFKRSGTFLFKSADIIKAILELGAGIASADIDANDVTALNNDQPAEIGLSIAAEQRTAEDAVNEILAGITAYGHFDRAGKWRMGQIKAPSGAIRAVYDESNVTDIVRLAGPLVMSPPAWRHAVGYKRNYTVSEDAAAGADEARRAFMAVQYREASDEDAAIKTAHPSSQPFFTPGPLRDEADAVAEAVRLVALFSARGLWRISTRAFLPDLNIGQVCRIAIPRMGLNSIKATILGIEADIAAGTFDLIVFA